MEQRESLNWISGNIQRSMICTLLALRCAGTCPVLWDRHCPPSKQTYRSSIHDIKNLLGCIYLPLSFTSYENYPSSIRVYNSMCIPVFPCINYGFVSEDFLSRVRNKWKEYTIYSICLSACYLLLSICS